MLRGVGLGLRAGEVGKVGKTSHSDSLIEAEASLVILFFIFKVLPSSVHDVITL